MLCVRDSNLTKSSVCIPNQLKLIGIFLPWHAVRAGCLEDECVWVLPSQSSATKTYLHIVYLCIHIYKHNYTRGKTLQQLPPIPQQPLRGQRSSMHHGQDVSRKLLSHNGATSSQTFVQIYKNLFELLPDIWGSRGERGHLTWLERCSTGNSSMSPTSVGHIRGSIFQQSLKLPTRSEGWCLAQKRCKSERDMPANEEQGTRRKRLQWRALEERGMERGA